MAELTLSLDSYDDIYSDFDTRNYRKRRLSDDFVDELRDSLRYNTEAIDELQLRLPADVRDKARETEIVSSIKRQVGEREAKLRADSKKWQTRGWLFTAIGFAAMLLDAMITIRIKEGNIPVLARIILEPAGWFLIWNGLDFLLFEYRKFGKDQAFHRTVGEMKIRFLDE